MKKYQYQLWEADKTFGKIANHIIIFGYNEGVVHFIKTIRERCDMPIVFLWNEDIGIATFKLNNLYGNIFHFWGNPFDKSHLEKACIQDAFAVLILTD